MSTNEIPKFIIRNPILYGVIEPNEIARVVQNAMVN